MKIFNKGFNFLQDGPGNRLVYHLSGCNLECLWCANPEGMDGKTGKDYTAEEIFEECKKARMLFFSGGEVTFTGGEATLWHDELLKLLKMLKENNINTAIETNGTSPLLYELLPYIDYLIMDFKHYDTKVHREFTGKGNEEVKKNFERNCMEKINQHIRIPLINGFNADNPKGFTDYFTQFDTEHTVFEFLPYHEYGKDKWKTEYKIKNGFINDGILRNFTDKFKEVGLKIIKT